VVPDGVGGQLTGRVAAMTNTPIPLLTFADEMDALLHYIPFLRKALAMADDPQKSEDEHVKQVKEKSGAK
jgi:hypothetical protein